MCNKDLSEGSEVGKEETRYAYEVKAEKNKNEKKMASILLGCQVICSNWFTICEYKINYEKHFIEKWTVSLCFHILCRQSTYIYCLSYWTKSHLQYLSIFITFNNLQWWSLHSSYSSWDSLFLLHVYDAYFKISVISLSTLPLHLCHLKLNRTLSKKKKNLTTTNIKVLFTIIWASAQNLVASPSG